MKEWKQWINELGGSVDGKITDGFTDWWMDKKDSKTGV